MEWQIVLALGLVLSSIDCSDQAHARSYVYRSYDATPGHVVYVSPLSSEPRVVHRSGDGSYKVRSNDEFHDPGSESDSRTEGSEEDERKVLHTKHSSESGESHEQEHYSKKGERGSSGHKSNHGVKKGNKGSYDKEDHSHSYANEGDRKKSYHDEDSHHNHHHAQAHQSKGGKHGEKKYHKKGSKTTGYHNVFHKDEFKKEHIFYDTADHSGHFKKYGSAHKHHANEAEDYVKGGHKEEAHSEKKDSRRGHSEEGKYDSHHHDFKKQRSDTKDYRDREEFGKKDGHNGARTHGYTIYHT
ncbi:histidine-rich glycoprotein-like [Uranotaenia lowii]|uniref:histidine-rich glycoprotein-like n=1 Tax=Uranotaenia lowii TaxID=190385 RepID=UPI00247869B7|nr:histidine-rich glycoprotein-like [Uranotaenia lowii]